MLIRLSAAGVTPEMRPACASVDGRARSSFSKISRDRPGIPSNAKRGGMALPSSRSSLSRSFSCLSM